MVTTGSTANVPTLETLLGWFDTLSNWGRWGRDDQLGCLNHVTPEIRRAGLATIRDATTVSCGLDIRFNVPRIDDFMSPPMRFMTHTGDGISPDSPCGHGGGAEFIAMSVHGFNGTHLDAPAHTFWNGRMYNGHEAGSVTVRDGAGTLAVTGARDGIATRGVLLDVAGSKGVRWLDESTPVFPEDLEEAEELQGVRVREGDAVLLRTGYGARRREVGPLPNYSTPGWHAACLPWFSERRVAMIGSDASNDVMPSGYDGIPVPVHSVGIVAMGLWLLDNADLERLAEACERLARWEFFFTISPLRLEGCTGSPVNPIAFL